jgi:hypothetical protein
VGAGEGGGTGSDLPAPHQPGRRLLLVYFFLLVVLFLFVVGHLVFVGLLRRRFLVDQLLRFAPLQALKLDAHLAHM